jgi:hypothetical protein
LLKQWTIKTDIIPSFCHTNGELVVVSNGKMAVIVNMCVSDLMFLVSVENEEISSLFLTQKHIICLGTTNGLFYKVELDKGSILCYSKNRDGCAILNIHCSGEKKTIVQTVSAIQIVENGIQNDMDLQVNNIRIVDGKIYGSNVIIFNKYASLRLFPILPTKLEVHFSAPEKITCEENLIMLNYDAIHVSENVENINLLLHDGKIICRKINI